MRITETAAINIMKKSWAIRMIEFRPLSEELPEKASTWLLALYLSAPSNS